MKRCTKCGKEKELEEFSKNRSRKDGFQVWCKVCLNKQYAINRRLTGKERVQHRRPDGTKRCSTCKEYKDAEIGFYKNRSTKDGYDHRCKICARKNEVLCKYNLTTSDYALMLQQQDNKCAICSAFFEDTKNQKIDHDHKTGKVRGILCTICNWGLGHFKDSTENLYSAIRYLEKK